MIWRFLDGYGRGARAPLSVLQRVRALMSVQGLAALIVPTDDAHSVRSLLWDLSLVFILAEYRIHVFACQLVLPDD
jgi:hypothetical protein